MPAFSVILQAPQVRALVQENLLETAFHDSLFPRLLFRGECTPVLYPGQSGDTIVYTSQGLLDVNCAPLVPGADPVPQTYESEQWIGQLQQLAGTVDAHMPTSAAACASLFLRHAQQLGMQGGQTVNRVARNTMYNAAESGWTVSDGVNTATATINVKRLNGFTRARRPDLAAGSAVQFSPVSAANPLLIRVWDTTGAGAWAARSVVAATPTTAGDEIGPGTLTLTGGVVTLADRAAVQALDRTFHVQIGGGEHTDDIGAGDTMRLEEFQDAVSHLRDQNVPPSADGSYHLHMDPIQESQVFRDSKWERLFTATGVDSVQWKEFAIGRILGATVYRNNECPKVDTVLPRDGVTFSANDPFAGDLYSNGVAATGVKVHRALLVGGGGLIEHYSDMSLLLTEAGVAGKIAEPTITNDGIEVFTDRIRLYIRQGLDRLGQMVGLSWNFIGVHTVRTDAATGDGARYKRICAILGGE